MDFKQIIIAIAVLCGISLIIGIVLSIAEKVFHVDVNEKEILIREELPGSNCGGCGYAGCDSCAKAIAEGTRPVSACPVGGTAVAKKIGSKLWAKKLAMLSARLRLLSAAEAVMLKKQIIITMV